MTLFDLILIAISLSMDAFAVSICKGLSVHKVSFAHAMTCGLWFGGFQFLMPTLGFFLGARFAVVLTNFGPWVAFVLLAIIGVNMVRESFGGDEKLDDDYSAKAMLPLAVATSIDAFAVGVSFAAMQVDFLPAAGRIGIIGICGWGGFAINAAANDTRIKATVASTKYDISRCTANGYFDAADNADARYKMRQEFNAQRTEDYRTGTYPRTVMNPKPAGDAPQFMKDYYDYYKTERGYHPRSINSGLGWNKTSSLAFVNAPILAYADEIRSAVLLIHGEKAHSRYFSEDAFRKLKGDNKELMIIPGAVHTDLYDRTDIIPFDKLEKFFDEYLK